jgi:tellurite resistance protein TerA
MNEFPYIYLSEDMGVNDQAGDNKETLRITNLELMNFVHIICWDYGGVEQGRAARFKESDIKLNVLDSNGGNYDLSLDTGDLGNVAVLATIDNSNSIGAKLINVSKAGTLKGLRHSDQLFGIIEGG